MLALMQYVLSHFPTIVTLILRISSGIFHPVNNLVVIGNQHLNLLSKILLFLNLVKQTSKNFLNSKFLKSVCIFSQALVVVGLLTIL
jgi:hypothetical protein